MLADTDLVVSVADVAITVTVLPGGIAVGAVYVDGTPLAVKAGLNDPQGEAPQVTVQFTWGFAVTSWMLRTFGSSRPHITAWPIIRE